MTEDCEGITSPTNQKSGLSEQTLRNYLEFCFFCCVEHMKFLRVKTNYTALIKYENAIEKFLAMNERESLFWSNFRGD